MLSEVGLVPRALGVDGAVEPEGEDAGLVGAGAAARDADLFWKVNERFICVCIFIRQEKKVKSCGEETAVGVYRRFS